MESDPLLGRVVGDRYRIVEPIAQGAMGRVYKAQQLGLERVVALKILGAGQGDGQFYKRFLLEASVTARLTHPNSITVYDYGRTDDGIFFIAMEYLNGRTLSAAMKEDGPLAEERVIHIAQQICRSLREAHGLGIIHRDLKPANVMLLLQHDDHDFVKVLDFGLVKFFSGEAQHAEISDGGTFRGSPSYMAPEQARNQGPDPRSDIYSLGVVLYQMLTGALPFTGEASVDVIVKHLQEPPIPPRKARPDLDIHPGLEAVVLRCLAKAREDRFQSMDEMLAALKQVRSEMTGVAVQESLPPPPPVDWSEEQMPFSALLERRSAAPTILAIAAIAAVAALSAFVLRRSAGPAVASSPDAAPSKTTTITVTSDPPGAEVRDGAGRILGVTPLHLGAAPGAPLHLTVVGKGERPATARMQASTSR